jgi:AcrR family transcriptional regulator
MDSELPPVEKQPSPPRRVPSQRRSRERVERILAVATALVAERGSDALRMSEVAERAGVSIGSLYQYFPDRTAIVRTLAERYNAQGLACVAAELAPVRDEAELQGALLRVVDGYYEMFLAEPAMRDVWWATQADRTLQDVDAADVEAHTALLADVMARLRPRRDRAELATVALLTMQLVATAVRLAISLDRARGDAVVAAFKRMLPERLLDMLG